MFSIRTDWVTEEIKRLELLSRKIGTGMEELGTVRRSLAGTSGMEQVLRRLSVLGRDMDEERLNLMEFRTALESVSFIHCEAETGIADYGEQIRRTAVREEAGVQIFTDLNRREETTKEL